MLRHNDSIRLTATERAQYDALAGKGLPAPTTVQEHDSRLENAAQVWEQGESAEEKLAAALARDLLIGA